VVPLRVDDATLNAEHKGRLKFRLNESYKIVDFQPHQCNSKCIEQFPYADGDNKSILEINLYAIRTIMWELSATVNLFTFVNRVSSITTVFLLSARAEKERQGEIFLYNSKQTC
jgi:hypothetical protein